MTSVSPAYLKSDTVLNEDKVYEGDLYIQSGTIDLNGYKLTVKGDLIQTGGTMYINGGQLEVEGDYSIGVDFHFNLGKSTLILAH